MNTFSARWGGNLSNIFPKIQMPGGLPGRDVEASIWLVHNSLLNTFYWHNYHPRNLTFATLVAKYNNLFLTSFLGILCNFSFSFQTQICCIREDKGSRQRFNHGQCGGKLTFARLFFRLNSKAGFSINFDSNRILRKDGDNKVFWPFEVAFVLRLLKKR